MKMIYYVGLMKQITGYAWVEAQSKDEAVDIAPCLVEDGEDCVDAKVDIFEWPMSEKVYVSSVMEMGDDHA